MNWGHSVQGSNWKPCMKLSHISCLLLDPLIHLPYLFFPSPIMTIVLLDFLWLIPTTVLVISDTNCAVFHYKFHL